VQSELKAAIGYFAIVFAAGFALGVVRVLAVVPLLGELRAVQIELPLILVISWVTCRWIINRYAVPDKLVSRLTMGGVAFAIVMFAELGTSVLVMKHTVAEHFSVYQKAPGALGLLAQIGFALFPVIQRRPTRR
jgi:hypothetical protein